MQKWCAKASASLSSVIEEAVVLHATVLLSSEQTVDVICLDTRRVYWYYNEQRQHHRPTLLQTNIESSCALNGVSRMADRKDACVMRYANFTLYARLATTRKSCLTMRTVAYSALRSLGQWPTPAPNYNLNLISYLGKNVFFPTSRALFVIGRL